MISKEEKQKIIDIVSKYFAIDHACTQDHENCDKWCDCPEKFKKEIDDL